MFCFILENGNFSVAFGLLQLRCWVKEKESFPMNLWWLIAVWPDVAWDAQLVRFSCSTTLVVFIYGRLSPYYSFIHPIDTLAAGCLGRRTGVPEKRDLAQTVSAVHGQAVWPSERLVWQKRRTAPHCCTQSKRRRPQPHTHVIESKKEMRLSPTIDALVSNNYTSSHVGQSHSLLA